MYDSADERLKEQREAMAVVDYNGEVMWMPPAIYKSTCSIDITYFPFDIQRCHMKFGSWTYDGFQLDIWFTHNASILMDSYIPSNEWTLIGYPARKNVIYYVGLDTPYPDLTFCIYLQRAPMIHAYFLLTPCVLLSFLTLVIFWLPPESPAKVMLGQFTSVCLPVKLSLSLFHISLNCIIVSITPKIKMSSLLARIMGQYHFVVLLFYHFCRLSSSCAVIICRRM